MHPKSHQFSIYSNYKVLVHPKLHQFSLFIIKVRPKSLLFGGSSKCAQIPIYLELVRQKPHQVSLFRIKVHPKSLLFGGSRQCTQNPIYLEVCSASKIPSISYLNTSEGGFAPLQIFVQTFNPNLISYMLGWRFAPPLISPRST